jgi:hypothetical protein
MKLYKYICIGFLTPIAMATAMSSHYYLGTTPVSESNQKIVIHAAMPVTVSIQPGGRNWPPLSLDEAGQIYAGDVVIDRLTGRKLRREKGSFVLPNNVSMSAAHNVFRFRHAEKKCFLSRQQLGLGTQRTALESLKNSNIAFSSASTGLLALVTQFGEDGKVANYRVEQLDLNRCKILFHQDLGNPDLLVELGNSTEGGWWLTGSIEQTLLQSSDGRQWRKATLPAGLSSLISAYVVNPHEIWLAAILPAGEIKSPYLLVYSGDGGRSWRNVVADDPILRRIPSGWLEGQRRRAQ